MAIKITREKNERGVKLSTLKVGDTFMYDNRIGVIVARNGHVFPLDLTTCGNFRVIDPTFRSSVSYKNSELPFSAIVVPVSIEMTYKVVG